MHRSAAFSLLILLALAVAVAAAEADPPSLGDLGWLAGHWKGQLGGAEIEELWLAPAGSQMIGINRTLVDGQAVAFENLRIEEDGEGVVYLASPGGRCPATEFRLESLESNRVVFSNPAHDFPQSIEYRREGDVLHAKISGTENGEAKVIQWSWTLTTTPDPRSGTRPQTDPRRRCENPT